MLYNVAAAYLLGQEPCHCLDTLLAFFTPQSKTATIGMYHFAGSRHLCQYFVASSAPKAKVFPVFETLLDLEPLTMQSLHLPALREAEIFQSLEQLLEQVQVLLSCFKKRINAVPAALPVRGTAHMVGSHNLPFSSQTECMMHMIE